MNTKRLRSAVCAAFMLVATTAGNAADPTPAPTPAGRFSDFKPHALTHIPTDEELKFLEDAQLLDKEGVHPLSREKLLTYSCNKFRDIMREKLNITISAFSDTSDTDMYHRVTRDALERIVIEDCKPQTYSGSAWQEIKFSFKDDNNSPDNETSIDGVPKMVAERIAQSAFLNFSCTHRNDSNEGMTLPEQIILYAVTQGIKLASREFPLNKSSTSEPVTGYIDNIPLPLSTQLLPPPKAICILDQNGALTATRFGGTQVPQKHDVGLF